MPKEQLHKRFTNDQVKNILAKYEAGELRAKEAIRYLEIGRTRFYQLVTDYEQNGDNFSIEYAREHANNTLNLAIEKNIFKELEIDKEIIDNPKTPTKRYNYSYVRDQLDKKYQQEVSVSTIINRAKDKGFWKPKPPKKIHDREVITNYTGELIQHDSSHHLFAPDAQEKWYLITSLDDYSRKILYANLLVKESTWAHINAVEYVFLKYGLPLQYYPDQHSIFRYIRDRDKNSPWMSLNKFTGDVITQWEQVVDDCGVKVTHALSPQAKGKMERPYGWLQDHLVRTCVRENITNINEAKKVLRWEINQYNNKRVHSTTQEIPDIRFNNAAKFGKTLFREFKLKPPFESVKDLFCLRAKRIVDAYRKISIKKCVLKVPGVMPRQEVQLRMYPDLESGITEVRFWHKGRLTGTQRVKNEELPIVHF